MRHSHLHNTEGLFICECAFQASSPKLFKPGLCAGLFLCALMPQLRRALQIDTALRAITEFAIIGPAP